MNDLISFQTFVDLIKPLVRYFYHTLIRFGGAESIIRTFSFGIRHAVENGGFSGIGQTDNAAV
jgi:hypothetical protein